tara:strand:+ start:1924 stop:2262 length:339 start_codon:yes stop_codon:yes gene_type:complete
MTDLIGTAIMAMPEYPTLVIVLFLSGVISYGVTQVVKIPCRKWVGTEVNSKDPWPWLLAFRLFPLLIGAYVGTLFVPWPWGASVGLVGAILNVTLYKQTSSIIRNMNLGKKG